MYYGRNICIDKPLIFDSFTQTLRINPSHPVPIPQEMTTSSISRPQLSVPAIAPNALFYSLPCTRILLVSCFPKLSDKDDPP